MLYYKVTLHCAAYGVKYECKHGSQPGFSSPFREIISIKRRELSLKSFSIVILFRRLTSSVFLDLKAASDSSDSTIPWRCPSLKGVTREPISLMQSLQLNSRKTFCAYGHQSSEFSTKTAVHQGPSLSPFLSSLFSIQMGVGGSPIFM